MTEEKYFEKFSSPDREAHNTTHKHFTNKMTDVRNRLARGELAISMEITIFLKDWLVEHIKGSDKQNIKCFNSLGLF